MKPFNDEDPELSSDLEWMLQSGQASPPMLAEVLVYEFYDSLYALAVAFLDEEDAARRAVEQAIGAALLHVYRYGNGQTVRTWLFGLALPIYRRELQRLKLRKKLHSTSTTIRRRLDALTGNPDRLHKKEQNTEVQASPPATVNAPAGAGDSIERDEQLARFHSAFSNFSQRSREAAWFYFLLAWSVDETAAVLQLSQEQVQQAVASARSILLKIYPPEEPLEADDQGNPETLSEEDLDGVLQAKLRDLPAFHSSPADTEQLVQTAGRRANLTGGWLFRYNQFKEVLFTGLAIVLITLIIFASSRLLPSPPPVETPPSVEELVAEAEAERAALSGSRLQTYTVRSGDTLELISGRVGVSAENLRKLNRFTPEQTPQPGSQLLVEAPLPVEPLPSITPLPPPEPLTQESSSQQIRDRLLERTRMWQTMWGDARLKLYGPPGYLGPAGDYRVQFWTYPQGSLVVFGYPSGALEEVLLVKDGTTYLAKPGAGPSPFSAVEDDSSILRQTRLLDHLAPFQGLGVPYPQFPDSDDRSFQVLGREGTAGRETLIVEQFDSRGLREARLWLEPSTGAILRRQQFGGPQMDTLLWEYQLTAVDFNVDLPAEFLAPQVPWRGGFARDYLGQPVPLDASQADLPWAYPDGRRPPALQTAPPGFDPATARLAFQFLDSPFEDNQDPVERRAYLFADDYYLGDIPFGDPTHLACDRSPDGRRFAFTSIYPAPGWQANPLKWFNLNEPERVVQEPMDAWPVELAFAPDSQHLAVFALQPDEQAMIAGGQSISSTQTVSATQSISTTTPIAVETSVPVLVNPTESKSMGALYLLDLAGEQQYILALESARSLVWSPNGQALAFIGIQPEHDGLEHLMVLDTNTGEVTFEAPYDSGALLGTENGWPGWDWGVEFPVEPNELGDCIAAP